MGWLAAGLAGGPGDHLLAPCYHLDPPRRHDSLALGAGDLWLSGRALGDMGDDRKTACFRRCFRGSALFAYFGPRPVLYPVFNAVAAVYDIVSEQYHPLDSDGPG